MRKWTDNHIKMHIDEAIEESYVYTLSEPEIRSYLRRFVEACENVLRDRIDIHADVRITRVKIALLKAHLLLNEIAIPIYDIPDNEGAEQRSHHMIAGKVIRARSLINRLLHDIHETLPALVYEEQKRVARREMKKQPGNGRAKKAGIVAGYYLLLVLVATLIWLVMSHST